MGRKRLRKRRRGQAPATEKPPNGSAPVEPAEEETAPTPTTPGEFGTGLREYLNRRGHKPDEPKK